MLRLFRAWRQYCAPLLSAISLAMSVSLFAPAMAQTTLYLNNTDEPTSLHPALGFNSISWEVANNLFEGLVRLDAQSVPQPGVAERWDISPDGLVYTFHLRKQAKWSDGSALTAHDFVYAWHHMLSPTTASPAAFLAYDIQGAQAINKGHKPALGARALDDHTLQVYLEQPNVAFLAILSNPNFAPLHRTTAQRNPQWHTEAATYVSNGPFVLKQWVHSQFIVLAKNPHYWDSDAVALDQVHFAMVKDPNTYVQMYRRGELDATPSPIPASLYDRLKNDKALQRLPQAGLYFFRLNTKMAPFHNQKIRQAFAYALKQDDIVQYVVKQGRLPAYGFVSPGFSGPDGKDFRASNGDLQRHDPEKAKRLLAEGMREEGYTQLPSVTLYYINSPIDKRIAETVQYQYSQYLGVQISLQAMESKVFFAQQRAKALQFSRSSFLNDYADPYNALESFITDSSMNRTDWSNAQYDSWLESAKTQTNAQLRWDTLLAAERLLIEQAPIIPLYFQNLLFLQKPNVVGIVRPPVGYMDLKHAVKR